MCRFSLSPISLSSSAMCSVAVCAIPNQMIHTLKWREAHGTLSSAKSGAAYLHLVHKVSHACCLLLLVAFSLLASCQLPENVPPFS